jgi:single-strand DNA-binding protein
MNVNSVVVAGRLTRDPEVKAMPSGSAVCGFSIATSRSYKDRDGKVVEDTEYHNVVVFGKQAENAGKYLVKGQLAGAIGRLKTRSWEKDGVKQYRTEIIAETIQFGPKIGGSDQSASVMPEYPVDELNPDDIPF